MDPDGVIFHHVLLFRPPHGLLWTPQHATDSASGKAEFKR